MLPLAFVLALIAITDANWVTYKKTAHLTVQQVDVIDTTIVMSSFTADTRSRCVLRCTRLTGALSVYYNKTSSSCYCNNDFDESAVPGTIGNGIMYSPMSNIVEQNSAGEHRYIIPEGYFGSCTDLHAAGYHDGGLYLVQHIRGFSFEIYCNMELEHWTVFQRRFDGSVEFMRNWIEYVNGFGSSDGEFWLGLENIHQRTSGGSCKLLIYLEAESNNPNQTSGYAKYEHFQIGGADTNYILSVSGFSGNVGNSFPSGNTMFSTIDVDNDKHVNVSCAEHYKGGWWYTACHGSNLNGLYLEGAHTSYADGMEWYSPWGHYYSLIKTELMFKCY